jgi:hypothetical protein
MGALAGTGTAGVPTPGGVGKHLSYCDTSHLKKSDTVNNKKGFLFTVSGRSDASAIATARRSGGRLYIMIGDHGVSIATSTAMVWRRRAREISWCMGVWQPTILPRTLAVHNYFFTFFTVVIPTDS